MKKNRSKTITWITLNSRRYGGFIFGEKARNALENVYKVKLFPIRSRFTKWKPLKPLVWLMGLIKLKRYKSDVWVYDDVFSAILPFPKKEKNIFVFYHTDSSVFPLYWRAAYAVIERVAFFNMRRADAIVTISEYWRKFMENRGFRSVYKIYPAFNIQEFAFEPDEVERFKEEYNLKEKPIVYIGNCQRPKGVVESYEALKKLDVHLVTSGEPQLSIPPLNLNLSYRDYLLLLKASSCVVTMSKFKEGWCMTAHEAMLCKTPVIGSGLGGMKELFKGGSQIICKDISLLRAIIENLLAHPEKRREIGKKGFEFAKQFTQEKFQEAWLSLITKLLQ